MPVEIKVAPSGITISQGRTGPPMKVQNNRATPGSRMRNTSRGKVEEKIDPPVSCIQERNETCSHSENVHARSWLLSNEGTGVSY